MGRTQGRAAPELIVPRRIPLAGRSLLLAVVLTETDGEAWSVGAGQRFDPTSKR